MGFLNLVILALTGCNLIFREIFPNPHEFQKKCLFISELFRSNLDKRIFCTSVCPNKHPLLKHPLLVVFTDLYTPCIPFQNERTSHHLINTSWSWAWLIYVYQKQKRQKAQAASSTVEMSRILIWDESIVVEVVYVTICSFIAPPRSRHVKK